MNLGYGAPLYKLPAVKECLYHPNLPTFRRMDIDTAAHKLPDEHCRTTSGYQADNFRNAAVSLYRPTRKTLACKNVTETGKHMLGCQCETGMPDQNNQVGADGTTNNSKRITFSGYSMRYLSPSVTGSWKYSLRQEPFLDKIGQRPVPANIYSRHRTLTRGHAVGISSAAWKP